MSKHTKTNQGLKSISMVTVFAVALVAPFASAQADEIGICPGLTFERVFCDRAAGEVKAEFTMCTAHKGRQDINQDIIEPFTRNMSEVKFDIKSTETADYDITRTPKNDLSELNKALQKMIHTHHRCHTNIKYNN